MAFTAIKNKAPLGDQQRVAVNQASPNLRRFTVNLTCPTGLVVQNDPQYLVYTVKHASGITVVGASVQFVVAPVVSGGTSTLGIAAIAKSDGSTATVIVTAADILSGYTAGIEVPQTLASTNPSVIAAGDTIRVTVTTSNNAVGTAEKGASVTLLCEAIEADPITESET